MITYRDVNRAGRLQVVVEMANKLVLVGIARTRPRFENPRIDSVWVWVWDVHIPAIIPVPI